MEYLLNKKLDVHPEMAEYWPGNPIKGREFQYVRDPFRPAFGPLFRMLLTPNPQRAEKKADDWVPPVRQDSSYLNDRDANWIVWLGHACFLLQLNGLRLLIDPQLEDMPFIKRRVLPPFAYADLRGVDYLLLSHDHRDHVDEKSIRTIVANNDIRKILAPLRLSNVIGKWVGDTPIEEAGWYQRYDLSGTCLSIYFLPTRHWCRRGLTDFNRTLWGSFMIETQRGGDAGARCIYFGGDSAQTSYWKEIADLFPNIDVAMMGIGAYKPDYMMQDNHANPAEAFQGFRDLGARYWWPMHHGTYDLSNEPPSEPIRLARAIMAENNLSDRLLQPAINEPWWGF